MAAQPHTTSSSERPSVLARAMLLAIGAYRLLLSPWIGQSCRFVPSCSAYAAEAIEIHGPATGSYLGTRRLLRCHPWCDAGDDPVPTRSQWAERPALFTRFTNSR